MSSRRMPPKPTGSFLENFGTLSYVPRFFRLIWNTSPALTVLNILTRLLQSVMPVLLLYVGKLIIDTVLKQSESPDKSMDVLWWLIAAELSLGLLSDIFNRIITLTDSLVVELYSNRVSVELIEKAA